MALGDRFPRPLVALLVLASATLGLGLLLKDGCVSHGDDWWSPCYNDIVPLYGGHHLDTDTFPYVDHPGDDLSNPDLTKRQGFIEYPVLTGLLMWFAAKLGTLWVTAFGGKEDGAMFLYMNAALLSGFALGTVVLLDRMVEDKRRIAYFAAGTALMLYAFHNWDLMAVFFVVLTVYWFERGKYAASGFALALGFMAKIFPIVAAPLLWLVLIRRHHAPIAITPQAARIAQGAAAATLGILGAAFLLSTGLAAAGYETRFLSRPVFNGDTWGSAVTLIAMGVLGVVLTRARKGSLQERDLWGVASMAPLLAAVGSFLPALLLVVVAGLLSGFLVSFTRTVVKTPAAWTLAGTTIAGIVAISAPFLAFGSRDLFFEIFRFHTRRTPNFETVWHVTKVYGDTHGWTWVSNLGDKEWLDHTLLTLVAAAFVGIGVLAWRRNWGAREGALAAILIFLLFNKIFSVQYALWVLPFFALLPLPAWSYGFWAACDAWVEFMIFRWFKTSSQDPSGASSDWNWMSLAVVMRAVSLLVLLAWLAWPRRRVVAPVRSEPAAGAGRTATGTS